MNRNEADLILRHYTHEHAKKMRDGAGYDNDELSVLTLTRQLAYLIDRNLTPAAISWLLTAWLEVLDGMPGGEESVNREINDILDTHYRPPHITRTGEQKLVAA